VRIGVRWTSDPNATARLGWETRASLAVASTALVAWPLLGTSNRWLLPWCAGPIVGFVAGSAFLRGRWLALTALGIVAVATLSTPWTFGGSVGPYEVGLRYGAVSSRASNWAGPRASRGSRRGRTIFGRTTSRSPPGRTT
jgi:hypothetical protein